LGGVGEVCCIPSAIPHRRYHLADGTYGTGGVGMAVIVFDGGEGKGEGDYQQ
jgi:hypothetical protein